jgi:hypothetical protein
VAARRAARPLEMVSSSEDCGGAGVSRKQAFGFGALILGVLVFGGNVLLLAGVGSQADPSAHSPCVDKEALCAAWAQAGECNGNSEVRPSA